MARVGGGVSIGAVQVTAGRSVFGRLGRLLGDRVEPDREGARLRVGLLADARSRIRSRAEEDEPRGSSAVPSHERRLDDGCGTCDRA